MRTMLSGASSLEGGKRSIVEVMDFRTEGPSSLLCVLYTTWSPSDIHVVRPCYTHVYIHIRRVNMPPMFVVNWVRPDMRITAPHSWWSSRASTMEK